MRYRIKIRRGDYSVHLVSPAYDELFMPICACGWEGAWVQTRKTARGRGAEHADADDAGRAHAAEGDPETDVFAARRREVARQSSDASTSVALNKRDARRVRAWADRDGVAPERIVAWLIQIERVRTRTGPSLRDVIDMYAREGVR